MGLDMYAVRKHYVKQWDGEKPEDRYTVKIARGGKRVRGIQPNRTSRIEEELMYWRKANHIHGWFVDNVQGGNDDCREYPVSERDLTDLFVVCERVMEKSKLVDGIVNQGTVYDKDHPEGVVRWAPGKVIEDATVAKKLLPTRAGFFFGRCEYDESYLDDVEQTWQFAGRALADIQAGVPGDIYYRSSW